MVGEILAGVKVMNKVIGLGMPIRQAVQLPRRRGWGWYPQTSDLITKAHFPPFLPHAHWLLSPEHRERTIHNPMPGFHIPPGANHLRTSQPPSKNSISPGNNLSLNF